MKGTEHRPSRPIHRGDVVLVAFPFTDLSARKLRPAVVLHVDRRRIDCVLVFVSTREISRHEPEEVVILPTHPEFAMTGLAAPSKIRASKLVTLAMDLVKRWLGRLGPLLGADLDRALVTALGIDTAPFREAGRRDERVRLARLHRAGGAEAVLSDLRLPAV